MISTVWIMQCKAWILPRDLKWFLGMSRRQPSGVHPFLAQCNRVYESFFRMSIHGQEISLAGNRNGRPSGNGESSFGTVGKNIGWLSCNRCGARSFMDFGGCFTKNLLVSNIWALKHAVFVGDGCNTNCLNGYWVRSFSGLALVWQ